MRTTMNRRIAAGVSAVAVSAVGFGLAGATTAGAAAADAAGAAHGAHAIPAAATPGTYEIFLNVGAGFFDAGQLYLNSDSSWSLQDYTDGGTWDTVGATLGMSDFNAGYVDDAAWGAKVSGTNLGSAASRERSSRPTSDRSPSTQSSSLRVFGRIPAPVGRRSPQPFDLRVAMRRSPGRTTPSSVDPRIRRCTARTTRGPCPGSATPERT